MKHDISASPSITTALILLVLSSPVPAQDEPVTEAAAPAKVAAAPSAAAETATHAVAEVTQPETKPPAGWKVFRKDEEVVWCTDGATTGSRVRKERQCMTPQQYQEMVKEARRTTEQTTRRPLAPIDRD